MKISSVVGVAAAVVALGSPLAANALSVQFDLQVGNILGVNVAANALPVLVPITVPPINITIPPKSAMVASTSNGSSSASNAVGMSGAAQMGATSGVGGTRDFGQAIASGF